MKILERRNICIEIHIVTNVLRFIYEIYKDLVARLNTLFSVTLSNNFIIKPCTCIFTSLLTLLSHLRNI